MKPTSHPTNRAPSTIGEFCALVRSATLDPSSGAARTLNTNVGSEGGFLTPAPVPSSLISSIFQRSYLLDRVTRRSTPTGSYDGYVVDESLTTGAGSRFGGLELPEVGQSGTIPFRHPDLRRVSLAMVKNAVIVPATSELAEDANLTEFFNEIVPPTLVGLMERRIVGGSGAGQALGVINGPALVTQAIEGTQTIANTPQFIATNAAKMLGQMADIESAAYYVNPELLTSLLTATTNSNEKTVITPPDALAPFGRIATRPLYPNAAAPAVGTLGDFVCASMSNYLVVTRGDVQQAVSMHVRFLQDEQLFRFTIRWNGAPMLSRPFTPEWATTPKSHYVALAARV